MVVVGISQLKIKKSGTLTFILGINDYIQPFYYLILI